jgi:hypothetical protein
VTNHCHLIVQQTRHSLRGKSAPLSNSNGQKPTHQPLVSLVPTPPASVDEYGEQVFREEAGRSCDDLRLTDSSSARPAIT